MILKVKAFGLLLVMGLILAGCGYLTGSPIPTKLNQDNKSGSKNSKETTEVLLYFPVGDELIAEPHDIPIEKNMPRAAVQAIFTTELKLRTTPDVPPGVKVLNVTVEDGLATVDFSREILAYRETPEKTQKLAVAAITSTLAEFPHIKKVQFSVEGKRSGKIDGKDIGEFWGHVKIKDTKPWEIK